MTSATPREVRPWLGDSVADLMEAAYVGGTPANEGCQETNWRGLPAQRLFLAAHQGRVDDLKDLLKDKEMRRRVKDVDNDKFGILHIVALSGNEYWADEVIDVLVNAGIDINFQAPSTYETALQCAVIYSRVKVVGALLHHGARVDISDWRGKSPIPTARKKCQHNGEGNQNCCKVLTMLLDAENAFRNNRALQTRANNLRHAGNKAFAKNKYERARELYTESLNVAEDYRAFANRSLCCIRIGQKILSKQSFGCYPYEICKWGIEAYGDAMKAKKMEPTFVKAHYRAAIAKAMFRDFPAARSRAKEGLKHCPGNEQLEDLVQKLNDLGIPDSVCRSPFAFVKPLIPGDDEPFVSCDYCRKRNPLPLSEDVCNVCGIPFPSDDTDFDDLEERLLAFILETP